ncbi:MAG: SEC-C domain-containing protein [Elusimicrobia bacterium]|nr:SEC-C domain-containing protein [Elusimicrobiota bacterium]
MSKIPEVPLPVWKNLYEAASRFAAVEPWDFLDDDELVGVQDPATGQMGYGCVLGALGEMFALCLYRGAEGFDVHQRMQRGEAGGEDGELMIAQNCLMAEFTDRRSMAGADRSVIKSLGLKFRGANAWPLFRSYLPGHIPWHLTEAEAVFLTVALQAARDFAEKVDAEELDPNSRPGQVFCYFPKAQGPVTEFETRWEPHPAHRPEPAPPLALDAGKLAGILAKGPKPGGVWEADAACMQASIEDRDRPYVPRSVLVVHRDSHFILNAIIVGPEKPPHQALADSVLKAIEGLGSLPEALHVRGDKMAALLAPLGKELCIRIEGKGRLDAVLDCRREMDKFMSRGRRAQPEPPPKRFDRRAMEKVTFNLSRKLEGHEFGSPAEANRYLKELNESGELKESPAPRSALEAAQNLMYEAFEEHLPHRRVGAARRALKISPDCADAYNLLAEETAASAEEARNLYRKGVEAGERALGREFFEKNAGHFWGLVETRPYMRAKAELARSLWELGDHESALGHWREMLRLNPNDNQGMRYVLAARLGELGRFDEVHDMVFGKQYRDDCGLEWLLMKALSVFAAKGPSQEAAAALREAMKDNEHFPEYFLGRKRLPRRLPATLAVGGEDEAVYCAKELIPAWRRVPGALDWLTAEVERQAVPKAGRNEPCPCGSGKKFKKCCGQ